MDSCTCHPEVTQTHKRMKHRHHSHHFKVDWGLAHAYSKGTGLLTLPSKGRLLRQLSCWSKLLSSWDAGTMTAHKRWSIMQRTF